MLDKQSSLSDKNKLNSVQQKYEAIYLLNEMR